MDVYGNQQLVGRFIKGMEEWVNLGGPKYTDYHIELIDPTASDDVGSYNVSLINTQRFFV